MNKAGGRHEMILAVPKLKNDPFLKSQLNQGLGVSITTKTNPNPSQYRGRFAPSPTGPLHAGSLASALGSWLDAKANHGQWLVRIEDIDSPRTIAGADQIILNQLQACGLHWDGEVVWQSQRHALYQNALDCLIENKLVYRCTCSRQTIVQNLEAQGIQIERHGELIYPHTCRHQAIASDASTFAWRLALPESCWIQFDDLKMGHHESNLNQEVGDFVLQRADGLFTYQLAVVVDDDEQGITHIVRGEDLLSNTARQIYLQQILNLTRPTYQHLPVVKNTAGEKLSKQTHAKAINTSSRETILRELNQAAQHLGLRNVATNLSNSISDWLNQAVIAWKIMR